MKRLLITGLCLAAAAAFFLGAARRDRSPEPALVARLVPETPRGGEGLLLAVTGRPGARFAVTLDGREYDLYADRAPGAAAVMLPLDIEAAGPLSLAVTETCPAGRQREIVLAPEVKPRPIRVVRLGPASLRMRRAEPALADQREQVLAALNRRGRRRWWRAPLVMPLEAPVSSEFAVRREREDFVSYHRGVDFAAPEGTPVRAVGDGRVVLAARGFNIYGNLLIIDHGQGVVSCYFHLSRLHREQGEKIRRGEVIAEVGNTGWSTGPHLHLGIYLQGRAVDPLWFIPFTAGEHFAGDAPGALSGHAHGTGDG